MPPTDRTEELYALGDYLIHYWERKPADYHFTLLNWCSSITTIKTFAGNHPHVDLTLHTCGYAACAIGHLPLAYPATQLLIGPQPDGGHYFAPSYFHPTSGTAHELSAVALYFNITEQKAFFLFSPLAYPEADQNNPIAVGERILAFLRGQYDLALMQARYG